MGAEIVWTKRAVITFGKRIAYLEKHWTEKEIFNFTKRVNEYLGLLKTQPLMYRQSARLRYTHIGVIIKQVSIVYRIKPKSNTIELLAFIDNRQNPKKQNF
jgi:hypothetical protein